MATKSSSKKSSHVDLYGPMIPACKVHDYFLENFWCWVHDFETRTAFCLWGQPGIGKTAILRTLAHCPVEYNGVKYDGFKVVYIPLANFEEMGDLLGLPDKVVTVVKDGVSQIANRDDLDIWMAKGYTLDLDAGRQTNTDRPVWVPTEDVPTVIIFDDWNRASGRIITGIMQLLQTGGTAGWQLPTACCIALTGNPDTDGNLVATLDNAIYGRIASYTLEPDVKAWVKWAMGQPCLSQAGVSFAREFPEDVMSNERSPLRDWALFCMRLAYYESKGVPLSSQSVIDSGYSRVGEGLTNRFVSWVDEQYAFALNPEDVLKDKTEAVKKLHEVAERQDIIFLSCERLIAYILKADYKKLKGKELENQAACLHAFLASKDIPPDIRERTIQLLADVCATGKGLAVNVAQWFKGCSKELQQAFVETLSNDIRTV